MSSKPSIPKGTRDFSAGDMLKREYIFDTIREVFRLYGYQPIETPAMENLSTLLGKYGDEGDKLLFRVLNSGDFLSGAADNELLSRDLSRLSSKICEKGLRYDLTVPFARYVVQHRDELVFPFRRYQIQPVWRADRPQKGRYREFFQCDADVIGSTSLLNEAELVQIIDDVFSRLGVKVKIKLNNRKILAGLAEYAGAPDKITEITIALDKFEKIGWENVKSELLEKGIKTEVIDQFGSIVRVLHLDNEGKLDFLASILNDVPAGKEGLAELKTLLNLLSAYEVKSEVEFDLTLARGLNYYTGAIIEVKALDVSIGSICGGGRYDNLTGVFGMEGVSGVGVSFGADRIFDVMTAMDLFGSATAAATRVLVLNFGETEAAHAVRIVSLLRRLGINSELYPDPVKLKKQFSYADARKIPYIIMAGDEEIREGLVTVRNMTEGDQKKVALAELGSYFNEIIQAGEEKR